MIYPVDSVIQPLNNLGLVWYLHVHCTSSFFFNKLSGVVGYEPLFSPLRFTPGVVPTVYCKGKVCIQTKWPIRAGAYPGFRSMKRLGVFLLPPGWNASPSQGLFAGTNLYTWVERVKCLAQEHNTMSPARDQTRTARSGDKRTDHEASTPPTNLYCTSWILDSLMVQKMHNGWAMGLPNLSGAAPAVRYITVLYFLLPWGLSHTYCPKSSLGFCYTGLPRFISENIYFLNVDRME